MADSRDKLAQAAGSAEAAGSASAEAMRTRAQALGWRFLEDLGPFPASAEFVGKVPIAFARRHGLIGLAHGNGTMPVALADPAAWPQVETLARHLQRRLEPVVAPLPQILAAINLAYEQRTGQAQRLIDNLETSQVLQELEQLEQREDLLDSSGRAPVIKLVNLLLFEAVKQGASDIHIQPQDDALIARMRIDGVLFDAFKLSRQLQDEIVSRIKVMGRMNIAEKRLPQDGRATVQVGDRVIDLRLASLPTSFGERVVIRLLDKSARLYELRELGMPPAALNQFRDLIAMDHGLLLVTGPTGAGKTTTLYAALQELDAKQMNILTLEDPIEYQLPGISQTQVSERKGMTFASGLRSVLRQDPDIIMVGEIRDRETAAMAIQSALTGHLVLSTLHTNDAASAVTRLLDLGVEPYLVASSVIGVLAQRLVRRVCRRCSRPAAPSAADMSRLGVHWEPQETLQVRLAPGCEACRQTGYAGRIGIYELLVVSDALRRCIQGSATAALIKETAVGQGMITLRDNGLAQVLAGVSTIEEVLRVTMRASQ